MEKDGEADCSRDSPPSQGRSTVQSQCKRKSQLAEVALNNCLSPRRRSHIGARPRMPSPLALASSNTALVSPTISELR